MNKKQSRHKKFIGNDEYSALKSNIRRHKYLNEEENENFFYSNEPDDNITTNNFQDKNKNRKKSSKFIKFILLAFPLAIFLIIAYLFLTINSLDEGKKQLAVVDSNEGNIINRPNKDELLFLLAGVDADGGDIHTRTDTLMLMKLNFKNKTLDVLSIPRDTRVKMGDKFSKINAAHSYGGIDYTLSCIRKFLNIDVDYYIQIDFNGVVKIIDAIGGIQYDIPKGINFEYDGVTVHDGNQHLDGIHTLMYLRHRKSYSTGDIGRVKAQQSFLSTTMKQIITPKNILHFPQIAKIMKNNVHSNIIYKDYIFNMLGLIGLNNNKIHTYIIPGEGKYIGHVSYYVPDMKKTKILVHSIFGEEYFINKNDH